MEIKYETSDRIAASFRDIYKRYIFLASLSKTGAHYLGTFLFSNFSQQKTSAHYLGVRIV